MKVFITGATGRLGKVIVKDFLDEGHEVIALVRNEEKKEELKNVIAFIGDLSSKKVLERGIKDCDVVVHCASLINYKDWESLKKTNIDGTRNILEVCRNYPIARFVYISSTAVYGNMNFANELTPPNPSDLYGKSKLEAENVVGEFFSEVPSTILRPSIIYGPTYFSSFSKLIDLASKGKLPIIGDGKNVIPLVHAKDVSLAVKRAIQTDFSIGKVYIINENLTETQEEIINFLYEILGVKSKPIKIPSFLVRFFMKEEEFNALSRHRILENSLAKKELKWIPKFNVYDGLRDMLENKIF
ncbi:MAG: NAD(P)-dependent oxidoreductase [Candidatus Micrarchaeia archaeon]